MRADGGSAIRAGGFSHASAAHDALQRDARHGARMPRAGKERCGSGSASGDVTKREARLAALLASERVTYSRVSCARAFVPMVASPGPSQLRVAALLDGASLVRVRPPGQMKA